MLRFLSAHINCLESQVDAYVAAQTMNRIDVEELMSIFVSLAGELEKALAQEQPAGSEPQARAANFGRLASVAGRIRGMATRLRKDGHILAGIDPFVRWVIRCRDIAQNSQNSAEGDQAGRGDEMTTRRGDEATSAL